MATSRRPVQRRAAIRRAVENDALDIVRRVLNRDVNLDALVELYNGLDAPARRPSIDPNLRIAFGFDANALFRVGLAGTRGADAVDFLRQQHEGPLIVPGQVIQELWNNILSGVEPQAKRLRKKFDELVGEMGAIDQRLGQAGEDARTALEALVDSHGDWIEPASQEIFEGTLQAVLNRAVTKYVPRREFYDIARVRKETKTPPGFRDGIANFGDFFVWADFLYSLAAADLTRVDAAVFVTNDVKDDWSRHGVAHPILVAEAFGVARVPFRLWTVQEFHAYVQAAG